jgi:hypothetical protein
MPESERAERAGLSRRQVLARGAAAAGVAWAAPVVRTTRAYATGASDGTERPCTHFYIVCINRKNRCWPAFPDEECDFPPSWEPEPCGNGWPKPWDGRGHPPWQSGGGSRADDGDRARATHSTGSGSRRSGHEFTYTPPGRRAAPGRAVAFAPEPNDDGPADDGRADDGRADDGPVAHESTTTTTGASSGDSTSGRDSTSGTGPGPSTDPTSGTGPAPSPAGVDPDAARKGGDPLDSRAPAARSRTSDTVPDRPDRAQFGSVIGADLPDPLPPPILDWIAANPGIKLETPRHDPVLTQTSSDAWACLLPAPPQLPDWWSRKCRLILGCYKNGNEFGGDAYADPNPRDPDQQGRRLIFPTRPVRFGGYVGRGGRPGDFRDDRLWESETEGGRTAASTAGPGRSMSFAEEPGTTDSTVDGSRPDVPDAPRAPRAPRSPSTSSPDPDRLGTGDGDAEGPQGADEPSEEERALLACVPANDLPFPWNLQYPLNLIVAYNAALLGIKLPPPPPGACVPEALVVDPTKPGAAKPGAPKPGGPKPGGPKPADPGSPDPDRPADRPSGSPPRGRTSPSSSSSTRPGPTTTTAAPAASAATAPVAHRRDSGASRRDGEHDRDHEPKYPHEGHFDEHECIVLIFCCP